MITLKSKCTKQKLMLLFCLVNLLALLAACGTTATTVPANAPTVTPTTLPGTATPTNRPATVAPATPAVLQTQAAVNTPFRVKYNQEIEVTTELLKIKFSGVSGDSRCPADVACAWSGTATINLSVQKEGGKSDTISLTIYGSSGAPRGENIANFGGYSISLDRLEPARNTKTEIKSADYVATLVVAKLP